MLCASQTPAAAGSWRRQTKKTERKTPLGVPGSALLRLHLQCDISGCRGDDGGKNKQTKKKKKQPLGLLVCCRLISPPLLLLFAQQFLKPVMQLNCEKKKPKTKH